MRLFDVLPNFPFTTSERWAIITYKHGIYEFRHELPNDLRLSICHWNLNNLCAHNFAKLSILRAYVSVHKFGIICLSEKYVDSSIDDESLEISGCYLIRSDHPSNKRRGGICIYYKNFFPLKVTGIRLLEECIAFDLILINKLCSFVALYRSPSQSQDDFATFF